MTPPMPTPRAPTPQLSTFRLVLEPLRVEHADEMVQVLGDPAVYAFTGGEPPSFDQLQDRYRQQVAGSGDPAERWHNWVVRVRADGAPVGYVQATVTDHGRAAELAWLVGAGWQRCGYAGEAAGRMADALVEAGATTLSAQIHPDHAASEAVARRIGLAPTGRFDDDGEQLWQAVLAD